MRSPPQTNLSSKPALPLAKHLRFAKLSLSLPLNAFHKITAHESTRSHRSPQPFDRPADSTIFVEATSDFIEHCAQNTRILTHQEPLARVSWNSFDNHSLCRRIHLLLTRDSQQRTPITARSPWPPHQCQPPSGPTRDSSRLAPPADGCPSPLLPARRLLPRSPSS